MNNMNHHGEDFDDDIPVGRVLSRREALWLLGGAGLGILSGCGGGSTGVVTPSATPTPMPSGTPTPTPVGGNSCVVKPELTIGPYFVDERLNRSDVRSDPTTGVVKQGVQLNLTFQISRLSSGACSALSGAMVDIWHTDALGKYSDIASEGTSGQKFLRGYQVTNSNGIAQFTTIYPGWYSGRAVHIHFRIRNTAARGTYDFVSQLFFNDSFTDSVYTQAPYNTRGARTTRNANDGIYNQGGSQLLLAPTSSGNILSATMALALSF